MMTGRRWGFVAVGLAVLVSGIGLARGPAAAEPSAIPAGQFGRLHALIKPCSGEDKWDAIPWLTSLWQARQRAAAQGKPILLWEMDGNPLGCT
jgi:hypothetical protein